MTQHQHPAEGTREISILVLIALIFLAPPASVLLSQGGWGPDARRTAVFSIFGYFPGVIYAIAVHVAQSSSKEYSIQPSARRDDTENFLGSRIGRPNGPATARYSSTVNMGRVENLASSSRGLQAPGQMDLALELARLPLSSNTALTSSQANNQQNKPRRRYFFPSRYLPYQQSTPQMSGREALDLTMPYYSTTPNRQYSALSGIDYFWTFQIPVKQFYHSKQVEFGLGLGIHLPWIHRVEGSVFSDEKPRQILARGPSQRPPAPPNSRDWSNKTTNNRTNTRRSSSHSTVRLAPDIASPLIPRIALGEPHHHHRHEYYSFADDPYRCLVREVSNADNANDVEEDENVNPFTAQQFNDNVRTYEPGATVDESARESTEKQQTTSLGFQPLSAAARIFSLVIPRSIKTRSDSSNCLRSSEGNDSQISHTQHEPAERLSGHGSVRLRHIPIDSLPDDRGVESDMDVGSVSAGDYYCHCDASLSEEGASQLVYGRLGSMPSRLI